MVLAFVGDSTMKRDGRRDDVVEVDVVLLGCDMAAVCTPPLFEVRPEHPSQTLVVIGKNQDLTELVTWGVRPVQSPTGPHHK